MKNIYRCPHCKAILNPSVKVILRATYRKKQGLLLLSPQPGNFKYICDDGLDAVIKPGSKVAFECPICGGNLASPTSPKLVQLLMSGHGGSTRRIEFSRTCGEHATFIIDEDSIIPFGEDADGIGTVNFFGS